jgi:nitroreductase
MSDLLQLMKQRSHIAPKRLVEPGPSAQQLEQLFTAAAQAPDHGRLRPWRFIVVAPGKRAPLGDVFAAALLARDASASAEQLATAQQKALRSPCLMLAVLNQAPSEPQIEIAERLVSLGCAIQNMMLVVESFGLGSGLTSGQALRSNVLRSFFQLAEHEV